jgi:hypothetical protein
MLTEGCGVRRATARQHPLRDEGVASTALEAPRGNNRALSNNVTGDPPLVSRLIEQFVAPGPR